MIELKDFKIKILILTSKTEIIKQLNYEGYFVIETENEGHIRNAKIFMESKGLPTFFDRFGCPDLFCYKSPTDYKFIELKKIPDTIRLNQILFNYKNIGVYNVEYYFYSHLDDKEIHPEFNEYAEINK